jgi:hypothetical protein
MKRTAEQEIQAHEEVDTQNKKQKVDGEEESKEGEKKDLDNFNT